jgi:integrase
MKDVIEAVECKHPRYTHRVRIYGPDGKRKDHYFKNMTEASAFAKKQREETGKLGTDFGFVTEAEREAITFWRAFTTSTSVPVPDLVSVLRDFKTQFMASKASVTLTSGIETFLENQESAGASDRHLASLKSRFARLIGTKEEPTPMAKILVSTITTGTFENWLNGLRAKRADKAGEKLSAVTRHNLSRTMRSFFTFAVERGWTLSNPVPKPKRSKNKSSKLAKGKAPAVLHPTEVSRFMETVRTEAPRMVPFWSLKFFAGIRDAEAARMNWEMIDLEAGEIHIPADVSKTAEARTVKIEPNLDAWLRPYVLTAGPIAPTDMARRYSYKKVLASLATKDDDGNVIEEFVFPPNAARHSYGTFHLYAFEDAGKTALQLGHKGNPAMLHEHYKNHHAAKHAKAFWGIMPAEIQGRSQQKSVR